MHWNAKNLFARFRTFAKTLLLVAICCTLCSPLLAQQVIVDSLQQLLQTETRPVHQIDFHIGLTRAYIFIGDKRLGEKHLKEARYLSEKHDNKAGKALVLLFETSMDDYSGVEAELTYKKAQQALDLARSIGSKPIEAMAQYYLAEYFIYEKNNYAEGIAILRQAIQKEDASIPDRHLGNIYKTLAAAYEIQGKDSLAIATFEQALFHFERIATHPFIDPVLGRPNAIDADAGRMNTGQVYIYLAQIYADNGLMEKALEYIMMARSIYETAQTPSFTAWTMEEAAKVYIDLGLNEEAITHLQHAVKLYNQFQLIPDLIDALAELGRLFLNAKDYNVAETYFLKELEYAHQSKDTIGIVFAHIDLSTVELNRAQYDEALSRLFQAERLGMAIQDTSLLSVIYMAIGKAYYHKQAFKKALAFQTTVLQFSQLYQDAPQTLTIYLDLAQTHLARSNLDSALVRAYQAEQLANQMENKYTQVDIQRTLSNIYEQKRDYVQALFHHKAYVDLNEQIYSERAQAKLKEEQVRQNVVDIQEEKERVEREAQLLASRNQLYLILAIVLTLALFMGGFLFNRLRNIKRQLESQNRQLQQLNTTKDKFFSIIAHDIRSPIVALDGVGEQMAYYLETNKPDKLNRLASRIDTTAKRLSALLDNLLNWALLQQGVIPYHPKAVNIYEVSQNILAMFQANADAKGLRLEAKMGKELCVFADEAALNTILRNLISNAIKFTPKGGHVSLSIATEGDKVFININDTGTGIAAEKLSKLFSLHKISEKGTAGEKGTGLGLTLVKELTELNKGSIEVSSTLYKGSKFTLTLPVAA